MSQFHSLVIKDIRKETSDCVSIAFDIPDTVKHHFLFEPGQNITLRHTIDGTELRRSYSICSSPLENELRIAVKKITAGQFSSHANHQLKIGDRIDVLSPSGRFSSGIFKATKGNYLALAAGSGITPVISIIKTLLATQPESQCTLIYGNKNRTSIIFKEELEGLKNKYIDRFTMHHVFSRETTDADVNHGHINAAKCAQLSEKLIDIAGMDHIFICGPEEMIFSTRDWLVEKGIEGSRIHFELFNVPLSKTVQKIPREGSVQEKTSHVTVKLDGRSIKFYLPYEGLAILDGALHQGADLPFACKGGVCATCKAKLISGEVVMDNNYALEAEELSAGFILTCQSHPRSEQVQVDFDAK